MRYWKGILYSLFAVLAVWRLSKMSMLRFVNDNSGLWHGGVQKKKAALLFSHGLHGWVYSVKEFTVTHATSVSSFGYYIRDMMPKHMLDAFNYNGILVSVSDVTLNQDEIDEMIESYGDGKDFLASLIPTEKKYVMELCKAFDDLPSHIDIPIRFTLFRRR